MDIREFINVSSGEAIRDAIEELANSSCSSAIEKLKDFLRYRESHTYFKHVVPRLACLGLLSKGPPGVRALIEILPDAPGAIYPYAIIEALWHASHAEVPSSIMLNLLPPPASLTRELSDETVEAAKRAFRDLVAESSENDEIFDSLMGFIYQRHQLSLDDAATEGRFRRDILESFSETRIRIWPSLLTDFRELIASRVPEERYQQFLATHPVFLDPLALKVIPKQRLGIEYVTDFVIQRLDDKFILVEIEKPQDSLFTQSDDFTAAFTHAVGQVLDFQQWINLHAEYARSLMPNISSPRGLLVMGRSEGLTTHQKEKLHRFNVNSMTITVITFDEVALQAERLYQNIYHRSELDSGAR